MEGFLLKSLKSSVLWGRQEKLTPCAKQAGGLRPQDTGSWKDTCCSAHDQWPEQPCPGSRAPPDCSTKQNVHCPVNRQPRQKMHIRKRKNTLLFKMVKRSHLKASPHAKVEHSEPQSYLVTQNGMHRTRGRFVTALLH